MRQIEEKNMNIIFDRYGWRAALFNIKIVNYNLSRS